MKKSPLPQSACLGCLVTLLIGLGLSLILVTRGAYLFSPGPLTALHRQNQPLQGFASHADFEQACQRCHLPFWGPTADHCLACHTPIAVELHAARGLHGLLTGADRCLSCHSDHLGREVSITRLNSTEFPHQQLTRFTLARHQTNYDGAPFDCATCHQSYGEPFDVNRCIQCHSSGQPAFIPGHRARFGDNCLTCHDGREETKDFVHPDSFPLEEAHAGVACLDCHGDDQFETASPDCYSCHAADDSHRGTFGKVCNTCHTPTTWRQVPVTEHLFPFDHGHKGQPSACQTCHPDPNTFAAYRCDACHEHTPAEVAHKHLEEGIADFQACSRCHPTGHHVEEEGDDDD